MDKIFFPDKPEADERFANTEEMTRIIGINLKRARLRRGFSLDEVSSRSNVSKSMLSDIERGRKCPTMAVLYKICGGIHVSLPSLLQFPDKFVEVIKKQELVPHKGIELQHMFEYDLNTSMEIHKFKIAPNTEVKADAHGEKVWEYIMVAEGVFTLVLGDDEYEVEKGEAIRFLSNRKHIYANRTDKELLAYDIVYYGG